MTGSLRIPELRAELLRRSQDDQDARFAYLNAVDNGDNADWAPVQAVDDDNLAFLVTVIGQHGWSGRPVPVTSGTCKTG